MDAMSATVIMGIVLVIVLFLWFNLTANKQAHAKKQIADAKSAAAREATIAVFERGEIPEVNLRNVVTTKGEVPLWSEPAQLYEERVLSRKWEGASKGISIPTGVLGMRVSLGKTRGALNIERGTVPIASGAFVITSKNLIFSGDAKSSKTALNKVIDVQCSDNGIILSITGRAKPWTVIFTDPKGGEVVRVALQRAYDMQTES